jgi:hypothetical protein
VSGNSNSEGAFLTRLRHILSEAESVGSAKHDVELAQPDRLVAKYPDKAPDDRRGR